MRSEYKPFDRFYWNHSFSGLQDNDYNRDNCFVLSLFITFVEPVFKEVVRLLEVPVDLWVELEVGGEGGGAALLHAHDGDGRERAEKVELCLYVSWIKFHHS